MIAHSAPSNAANPWAWHPHPDVWLLMTIIAAAYVFYVARIQRGPVNKRKAIWFASGLAVLWIAADWPIHDIAEGYLFSVHMVQHLLITLVAPPLLLLGLPTALSHRVLVETRFIHFFVRRLSKPLVAGLVYNAVFVLLHWPVIVNATLRSAPLHFSVHVLIFVTAAFMWLPVVNRLSELPRLSYPLRMVYLFLQSVIPTVPASFITFAEKPIYSYYADVPHTLGLSAVEDQQLAGAIMKVGGGAVLWTAIIIMFFRWYSMEQRNDDPDVLTWEDVEHELQTPAPR